MRVDDITHPDVIRFLNESYAKTDKLRMRWIWKHAALVKQCAALKGPEKGYFESDVLKHQIEGGLAATTRDFISSARNRIKVPEPVPIISIKDLRKDYTIPKVGLGDPKEDPRLARPDDDLTQDPIMKPIVPNVSKYIYKGLPHYGREYYLKLRNKVAPEDKYYFPESYGWQCGWRMKDSYFGRQQKTSFGRVWRLNRDNRSRTGPRPDPPHYRYPGDCEQIKCS